MFPFDGALLGSNVGLVEGITVGVEDRDREGADDVEGCEVGLIVGLGDGLSVG